MVRLGICAGLEQVAVIAAAGGEFVEPAVGALLNPLEADDAKWTAPRAELPILAANVLMTGGLKIVGPEADAEKLDRYLATVMRRAKAAGLKTIVFGSGGARNVPDGFDRSKAFVQVVQFGQTAAKHAAEHGLTVALETLNRGECNFINRIREAVEVIDAVGRPNFGFLADSYHIWMENDSLEDLKKAAHLLRHVHVADREGRVFPGESGGSDYRAFFGAVRSSGYDGPVSIEAMSKDIAAVAKRSLDLLRKQWELAG